MVKRQRCEIFSRVCGYFRPVSQWNKGKVQEFKDRLTFKKVMNEKPKSRKTV